MRFSSGWKPTIAHREPGWVCPLDSSVLRAREASVNARGSKREYCAKAVIFSAGGSSFASSDR